MKAKTTRIYSKAFPAAIATCRTGIDSAIKAELDKRKESVFYAPLKTALEGGKRLRPILLILSCESTRRREANPFPAAVAVELAHMESLIHDDIIDRDHSRREKGAFHILYGYEKALLSADFILSMILDITARYSNPRINHELALATSMMSEGELEEFNVCKERESITTEGYINIVSKKTASLFKASAAIGAIIGGANEDETKAVSKYAESLGIAYQVEDDISDSKEDRKEGLVSLLRSETEVEFSLGQTRDSFVVDAKQRLQRLRRSKTRDLLVELADSVRTGSINRI